MNTTNTPPAVPTKFCHACGQTIDARAEICPKCGVRQVAQTIPGHSLQGAFGANSPSGKNRTAAALFALLLGGLGIHKFYLGQVGMGVIYLLLSWTFIPAIIGFIEGIVLLTMSDAAFAQKYP